MKTSRFLQTVAVCALGGCALTHYESLDQKTETEIAVSSNVPASLWIKGKELQPVRKEHILKQAGLGEIVLKAEGYHDAHVLIYRSDPTKKNVTSHESTAVWTTKESSDVTSNVSDLGADAATTSPTSTVKLVYNIGKFVVDLVVLPFDFTTKFNPLGYYLAYDKNQFYVEMTPLNAPEATVRDVRNGGFEKRENACRSGRRRCRALKVSVKPDMKLPTGNRRRLFLTSRYFYGVALPCAARYFSSNRANAAVNPSAIALSSPKKVRHCAQASSVETLSLRGSLRSFPYNDRFSGTSRSLCVFNSHGLRHHSAFAWLSIRLVTGETVCRPVSGVCICSVSEA